jgi:hypothetical protein
LKKTWCLGELDALFLARMEQLLYLYALPYDEHYPVVCFDERPCFLIGERVEGLAMKAGQAAREHYRYTKNGSCALLMAIEPKTGQRLAHVLRAPHQAGVRSIFKGVGHTVPARRQDPLGTG